MSTKPYDQAFKFIAEQDPESLLLMLGAIEPRHPPKHGVAVAGGTRIETRFHLIRLWRISARKALESGRETLLPFLPLMDGRSEELVSAAEAIQSMPDERRRIEMELHFVLLGALRYNQDDLKVMLGGTHMMPIERLRESSFYQLILKEGREEGREEERKAALLREGDIFRLLADKRFPGIQLGPEVEAVGDPDKLHRLCHELDEIPDPETLRRRLIEMAPGSQSPD